MSMLYTKISEGGHPMDESMQQKVALFRYALIAPILNETYTQATAKEYLESVCSKNYDVPYYGKREFSPATLKTWLLYYRKHGIDGLKPSKRSDKGNTRVLSEAAKEYITRVKMQTPEKAIISIYHELLAKGIIEAGSVSPSSIQRFVHNHNLNKAKTVPKDRRAFSMEYPGDCWQTDISQGPYLTINGKKMRTYLTAFIDDASRAIMAASFSYEQNLISVLSVFKQAVQRRGIPKKLFMDNGKVFRSDQLQYICASLGTIVSYAAPYSAASKGKIERWFKTLQSQWLNLLDWNSIASLEELNQRLQAYIETQYHQAVHSTIKAKPLDKYMEHINRIRFIPSKQELDNIFLYRVTRKIKNDATVSISNVLFEVSAKYIGDQVQIRYDPSCLDKAYIFNDSGVCLDVVYPVDRVANSRIPRSILTKNTLDFSAFSHESKAV
jgi:transposase InsO family protein